MEKALEVQKDVFSWFVDYEKAFDEATHEKVFEISKNLEVDGKDLTLIKDLYWRQNTGV